MKRTSKLTKIAFIFGIVGVFMLDVLLPIWFVKIFIPMQLVFLTYNILQFIFSSINRSNNKIMNEIDFYDWKDTYSYGAYRDNAKDKNSSFSWEMGVYTIFSISNIIAILVFIAKN